MKSTSFVFASVRPRCGLLIGLVLAAIAVAPRASADEVAGTAKSAQLIYRQATDAFEQKKYEESRSLLLGLWEQSRTYDVAVLLSQDEYQLHHYAAAASYLEFAIANIPPAEKLSATEELRKNLGVLKDTYGTRKIDC